MLLKYSVASCCLIETHNLPVIVDDILVQGCVVAQDIFVDLTILDRQEMNPTSAANDQERIIPATAQLLSDGHFRKSTARSLRSIARRREMQQEPTRVHSSPTIAGPPLPWCADLR